MSSQRPPTQTPAGWYPAEGDTERYWSGTEWTSETRPRTGGAPPTAYQQAPVKKKHTLRNVLLIVVLLFILLIGGCMALVGGFANEVDKSIKKEQANDKPTDVTVGKAFTHDGYNVAGGWRLVKEQLTGDATIAGLRVTNTKSDELTNGGRTALLTFRLYKGTNNLAEITCTGKELQKGESSTMDCSSTDKLPKKFTAIRVADLF